MISKKTIRSSRSRMQNRLKKSSVGKLSSFDESTNVLGNTGRLGANALTAAALTLASVGRRSKSS